MPELHFGEVLLRVVLAGVLGGAIGAEREIREREAGLRTHMLVAVGAALFTIVSAYAWVDFEFSTREGITFDPTRIAAQIVTGIGFLGAGAIIRQGLSIRGLTTAATLWVAAAIGIAAGAGYYSGAVAATLITLLALWPLRLGAHMVFDRLRPDARDVLVELRGGTQMSTLLGWLDARNATYYGNRGNIWRNRGALDRAIADYDKAIALSGNFAPAYYERAQAHYLAGRFREALADATKAAELNANWAQAISLRGLIQEKLGARDAAIADLRRAAALDPALQQPADALRRLGVMR